MKTSTALIAAVVVILGFAGLAYHLATQAAADRALLTEEGHTLMARVWSIEGIRFTGHPTSGDATRMPIEQARSAYARNQNAQVPSLNEWAAIVAFHIDHDGTTHERRVYVPLDNYHLYATGSEHQVRYHPEVKDIILVDGEQIE